MADALLERILRLEDEFFAAIKQGSEAIANFNASYADLRNLLHKASAAGILPDHVRQMARSSAATIMQHANLICRLDAGCDEVVQSTLGGSDVPVDLSLQPPCTASIPLFDFLLSHICFPYPDSTEKEHLAEEVRQLGWRDFDKKKLEDWLNRKRNQSGFASILHHYCHDDREEMRRLCETALFGSASEKAALPDGAVDDINVMREYLQSQYDDLADEQDTTWLDDLTASVEATVTDLEFSRDCSDALSSYDSSSESSDDSASDWSSTDVEEDEDDDYPRRTVCGKRKLSDPSDYSPSLGTQRLSRSPSMASSASSDSTACSLRSISGAYTSCMSTVEWDDDDDLCDRPAKRSCTTYRSDPRSGAGPRCDQTVHFRVACSKERFPPFPILQNKILIYFLYSCGAMEGK